MKKSQKKPSGMLRRLIIGTLGLALASVAIVIAPTTATAATGNILPPFTPGESWGICQGYQSGTHANSYALDLTAGPNCDNGATGRAALASEGGTVYWTDNPTGGACINTTSGRSFSLGHLRLVVGPGAKVVTGQKIGTVAPAGEAGNNGVAHIHFQFWASPGCSGAPNGGIPFDSAHKTRICGAPDLPANGPRGNGTWSGTTFKGDRCGTPAPSHPTITSTGSVVAIDPAGNLLNYGAKTPLLPVKIGPGWSAFKSVHVTDWNSDGVQDLLGQRNDGSLVVLLGKKTGGFQPQLQIGHGWGSYDIQVGKFDGPSTNPGIIARNAEGKLFFYANYSGKFLETPRAIGQGWNVMSDFTSMDWNRDGYADVLAIEASTGNLLAYVKTSTNTFAAPQIIGKGWKGIRIQAITGFNGPQNRGILAVKTDGTLHYYPINGTSFGTPSQIGNGWTNMKIAGH